MRFVFYVIAAILLAVLAVGVSFSYGPAGSPRRDSGVQREVFVDVAKLMRFHPSYDALTSMEQVAADLRLSEPLDCDISPEVGSRSTERRAFSRRYVEQRLKLESRAAEKAANALCKLDFDQRVALDARARAAGFRMRRSFLAEALARARQVSNVASLRIGAMAGLGLHDRVNAQLRVIAMRRAAKGLGVDLGLGDRLSLAETQLKAIDDERDARLRAISDEARSEIEKLFQEAQDKAEEALAEYRHGESNRIEKCSAVARHEIVRELHLFDGISFGGRFAPSGAQKLSPQIRAYRPAVVDVAKHHEMVLCRRITEVKERMRRDVVRAAQSIARENGCTISFSRGRLPDQTHWFGQLLRERLWEDCEPVLSRPLGS